MSWNKSILGHYESYPGGYELRETPKGKWKVTHNGVTFGIYNRKTDARQAVEDTESGYVPPDDGSTE